MLELEFPAVLDGDGLREKKKTFLKQRSTGKAVKVGEIFFFKALPLGLVLAILRETRSDTATTLSWTTQNNNKNCKSLLYVALSIYMPLLMCRTKSAIHKKSLSTSRQAPHFSTVVDKIFNIKRRFFVSIA